MTTAENHKTRAFHIKTTWGRHCDTLLFMSDGPAQVLDIRRGRQHLWAKTVAAFKHVHNTHGGDYDWVIKADDDTFMFIENARQMVQTFSPDLKVYFGFNLKLNTNSTRDHGGVYPSGGAGYILSKACVDIFVKSQEDGEFLKENFLCPNSTDKEAEDVNLGYCLNSLGAKYIDTRDHKGRQVFSPIGFHYLSFKPWANTALSNLMYDNWWFFTNSLWPVKKFGSKAFSSKYISSHYVNSTSMYQLYFLLYTNNHLAPVNHLRKN